MNGVRSGCHNKTLDQRMSVDQLMHIMNMILCIVLQVSLLLLFKVIL